MSVDLFHWERIGLATFAPYQGIDFVHVDNKDASMFPTPTDKTTTISILAFTLRSCEHILEGFRQGAFA